jgi:amidase
VTEGRLPTGGHELTQRYWSVGGDDDTGADVYRVLRDWDRYRSVMLGVLADADLLLTPVAPHAAVPPGAEISWRYTTPHSLTGWPCAVVRAGASGPLPIGVQVVAGPWQDHVALAAAAVIERALGGWQPPP